MKTLRYLGISLIVLLIDQGIKIGVKRNMFLGEEIPLIGDFFNLYFAENNGFAFGLTLTEILANTGISLSPYAGKFILSIFSWLAIFALILVLRKFSGHKSLLPVFIAIIIGGALGNIIDRTFYGLIFSSINLYEGGLFHGQVVDMFIVSLNNGSYTSPIFNVADVAISIGILAILLFQKSFLKRHEKFTALNHVPDSPNQDL